MSVRSFACSGFVALSAMAILVGCSEQGPEDHKIINSGGKTVLELGSDSTMRSNRIGVHFVEGNIIRGRDLHWRYMQTDGTYLPGEFYRVRNFSDGLAAVEPHFELNKDGFEIHKVGFINESGKMVITPQFVEVREFREGLCPVKPIGQKRWGVIDKTGNWIVKPIFEDVQVFSKGLLPVQEGGLWGYADKVGATVIAPQYAYANCFHDGLALVLLSGAEKQWACIKPDGSLAFECLNDGLSGNKTFSVLGNPAVSELIHENEQNLYSCGFAGGRLRFAKDDKYGFYDTAGKVVIEPEYDYADNFSEGRAAVVKFSEPRAKVTYIDIRGQEIIVGNFDRGRPFHEGKAAVHQVGGDWIYIDDKGKQVFKETFDSARSFYDGRAVVNYLLNAPI